VSEKYRLEGKNVVRVDNLMEWADWFERANRVVDVDIIGDAKVSTVFLGIDHSIRGERPTLFETLVFGGDLDGECERYSTYEEAEAGHARWIDRVKEGTNASR